MYLKTPDRKAPPLQATGQEPGEQEIIKTEMHISDLVTSVVNNLPGSPKIRFHQDCRATVPANIDKLQTVLRVILISSIKTLGYLDDESINISCRKSQEFVTLCISSKENEYYGNNELLTEKGAPSLYAVRRTIEDQGGALWVEVEKSKGVFFFIKIPFKPVDCHA